LGFFLLLGLFAKVGINNDETKHAFAKRWDENFVRFAEKWWVSQHCLWTTKLSKTQISR